MEKLWDSFKIFLFIDHVLALALISHVDAKKISIITMFVDIYTNIFIV